MGKQHDTFPGEQPEMPQKRNNPEIEEPVDPKEPEIPIEDPEQMSDARQNKFFEQLNPALLSNENRSYGAFAGNR